MSVSEVWSDDELESELNGGEYTTHAGDTWMDVCEIVGVKTLDDQERYLRDWIRKGELDSRYINTKLNCSDILTKAVSTETADTLGAMLSGDEELPETPEPEDAIRRF